MDKNKINEILEILNSCEQELNELEINNTWDNHCNLVEAIRHISMAGSKLNLINA